MEAIIEQLYIILEKLNKLYYEAGDQDEQEKIETSINNLSEILERAMKSQFDENEKAYMEAMKELKKTAKRIDEVNKSMNGITNIFKLISDVVLQLETLITKPKL